MGLLALAFYWGAVLRLDYSRTSLLDLPPYPDASEYYAMARSMQRGDSCRIRIGHELLPARYPAGYSVLMLPWLWLYPEGQQILAPFRASQCMGLLLLCATWLFYWTRGQPLAAGVAALLLATLPGFANYSRAPMSEISGAALVCVAMMLALDGIKRRRLWPIYCCSALLGLAVNIRLQLILFGPALLAMPISSRNGSPWRLVRHSLLALLVFALAASPVFVRNALDFGHPFATGYDFWVPGAGRDGRVFSARFVGGSAIGLLREFMQVRNTTGVGDIFGTGVHFTPAFVVLACAGLVAARRWKGFLILSCACGCYLLTTACYYYQDGRMYLPILMLMVPAATVPVVRSVERLASRQALKALPALGLAGLAVAGFPSQSGWPPQAWRSQFVDLLSLAPHDRPNTSPAYAAANNLSVLAQARPGVVLSPGDAVFLNAVLPAGFAAAPLDGQHEHCYSRKWHYDGRHARALAQHACAQALPVYALFSTRQEMKANRHRLPEITGWHWQRASSRRAASVILRLSPD
ncbi:MAG: glycosyltransferase family 39 protein [Kiritimatiellae bacterium]|nr:glycosyltransferase family 39 protein [Kiritimatiellia bacterium]